MKLTLRELADFLATQSMPAQIEGDPATVITAVNTLEDATPSEISFLANPKYEKLLATTRAGAVIVDRVVKPPRPMTLVRMEKPYPALMAAIVRIHGYRQHPNWGGIHLSATLGKNVQIGKNPRIGPGATVESDVTIGDNVVLYPGVYVGRGCRLGNDVVLYPHVVIYEQVILGHRVTIHAGSVIGEDGLGYAPVGDEWFKIPQVGNVVIEDDVEIGANCTIDRATLGRTVIGRGSKLSNLIAIGHGTRVGEQAMFVAQVGLAGSVTVGKHVQMAGQAGVVGHVHIGDRATVGAKAGVVNDVEPNTYVLGQPAIKASDTKRHIFLIQKLPEMRTRLKALEAEVAQLKATLQAADPPK